MSKDRDRAVFQLPIGHTPSLEDGRDPLREDVPALPNTGSEADAPVKLTYICEVSEEGGEA